MCIELKKDRIDNKTLYEQIVIVYIKLVTVI